MEAIYWLVLVASWVGTVTVVLAAADECRRARHDRDTARIGEQLAEQMAQLYREIADAAIARERAAAGKDDAQTGPRSPGLCAEFGATKGARA